MARDLQSIVKMSRREGYALHPKAHKVLVKRSAKPGQLASFNSRTKNSQYSLQLREKQKVKRLYGLLEKQFAKLMKEATKKSGQAGHILLQFLEQRADNVLYRSGFAISRRSARQLISHGHLLLNSKPLNIPSVRLKTGDKLTLKPKSAKTFYFTNLDDLSPAPSQIPAWLKVDRKKRVIEIVNIPNREDIEDDINEQLIVEYYSR